MSNEKMVKIDTDRPIPQKWTGRPMKYPWDTLKVGESFYIPNQHSPFSLVQRFNESRPKKYHIKIRRRIEGEGQRVWRIK